MAAVNHVSVKVLVLPRHRLAEPVDVELCGISGGRGVAGGQVLLQLYEPAFGGGVVLEAGLEGSVLQLVGQTLAERFSSSGRNHTNNKYMIVRHISYIR